VRTALRRDSRGAIQTDLVVEVTQRRRGFFERDEQEGADRGPAFDPEQDGDFKFRAGCTIVIDTTRNAFRHVIQTPGTVADDAELELVRAFLARDASPDANAFNPRTRSLRSPRGGGLNEPFALLHRHGED
jgi:hypothetical protein